MTSRYGVDRATRTIGLIEIWGGFAGLYVVIPALQSPRLGLTQYSLLAVAVVFYLASLYAGVLLSYGRSGGVPASMAIQAIQFVAVAFPQFRFNVYSGALLLIGIAGSELEVQAELASGFFVGVPNSLVEPAVGLNLLAIAFFVRLRRIWSRRRLSMRNLGSTTEVHEVESRKR